MSDAHSVLQALSPVNWESFAQEDSTVLMTDIFGDAHCLIDSIPKPSGDKSAEPSDTEPPSVSAESTERANKLRKEWKEVKVNARDNPLGLSVYKMAAKDGKGAWFARRSVHEKVDFKKWKMGMEREFAESLKVQGQPGDGKIRGLGADKCVVDQTVDGRGKMQVYQLSAQFPGPTSPRDFVTLCLSSDTTTTASTSNGVGETSSFMLVSKPCVHPECPERQGFIRGYYESVEFIRVIATDPSPLAANGPNDAEGAPAPNNDKGDGPEDDQKTSHEGGESVLEWTMITRSDPGGSVPRFIIEKKTPEGITQDANKFFQWISSDNLERLANEDSASPLTSADTTRGAASINDASNTSSNSTANTSKTRQPKTSKGTTGQNVAESPGPGGVYGMISAALSMVASAAASRLLGPADENENESELSSADLSDNGSSIHSFHSLDGAEDAEPTTKVIGDEESALSGSKSVAGDSLLSAESTSAGSSRHDKELKKLEERRRKTEEKLQRARERALSKKDDDAQRDELALQKLCEKHEREKAKQEEKYQRERRKLEEKRANEEKKAEERRRKQAEREQKANVALELEKARAERDIARREVAILTEQIGQLQTMNTKLVARLGREGISLEESLTPSSGGNGGGGLTPGKLSRATSEQGSDKTSDGVKS